jgi:hypothetical protein
LLRHSVSTSSQTFHSEGRYQISRQIAVTSISNTLALVGRSLTIDQGPGSAQRLKFRHAGITASARKRGYRLATAWGRDSKTQIKPFYAFERRNELDSGSVVEERCYATRKRLSANQGGGDDANVIFGAASVRMLRIGHRARLKRNYANIKTPSEFLLPQCQSTNGLSLHGVRLSTQGRTLVRFRPK